MSDNRPRRRRNRGKGGVRQAVIAVGAESGLSTDGSFAETGRAPAPNEPEGTSTVEPSENGSSVPVQAEEPKPRVESPGEVLFRRAREVGKTDVSAAIALYQELLRDEPDNIRARNNLGCLFDEQGQHSLALEQYEAARSLAPDNIEVLLNIGDALAALTRYDQSEREYRRAIKLDPSRPDVYLHLGILQYKRGQYPQAELELKKAIDLDPDNSVAHFYRGESLNQLSRVDEALDALLRAVQLQPNNS